MNPLKKNFLQLPAGKYGKSTKRSPWERYQVNESKSGSEAERVQALGALRSLRSKKKLVAEKWQETEFLCNKEEEKWNEDYVEIETAGARQQVEDTEAAIRQEQEDTETAANMGWRTREPEKMCPEMMIAIGDSLSDIASSNDEEDGEDENDEETEQGKLSKDDKPSWVMGTISDTVQKCMVRFPQQLMKLN